MPSTIEIFCCYAREDQPLLQSLKAHLMPLQWQGLITICSDTDINAGAEWEYEDALCIEPRMEYYEKKGRANLINT